MVPPNDHRNDPSEQADAPNDRPALRPALAKLREKAYDSLTNAEEALLRSTLESLNSATDNPAQAQLHSVIASMLAGLDTWRISAKKGEVNAEPRSAEGVIDLDSYPHTSSDLPEQVLDAEALFQGGHRQQVTELGGVPVHFMARCYQVEGNVRVLGDVPDNTLLVVRGGSLHVEGYVLGHAAASSSITISANAGSATVISRYGDITAGRLLQGATIVASEGTVTCDEIDQVPMVYAGESVIVTGDVRSSRIMARTITIGGAVVGSELQASGPVHADALKPGPNSPSVICLRAWFTTGEYGSPPADTVTTLRRALTKLRYQIRILDSTQRYLQRDIANSRRVLLYYLAGHIEDRTTLCLLRGAYAHAALLDQTIDAGASLHQCIAAQLAAGDQADDTEVQALTNDCLAALGHVRQGARAIPADFFATYQEAFEVVVRRLAHTARKLCEVNIHSPEFSQLQASLGSHLDKWRAERDLTIENARTLLERLGIDRKLIACIEDPNRDLAALLEQALEQAGKEPAVGKPRSEAGFVRLMRENLRIHEANLERVIVEAAECNTLETRLSRKLLREPGFVSWERDTQTASLTANRFDKGVIVTSMSGCTEASAEDNAPAIRIDKPITESATFILQGSTILRA